ncbi:Fc receptor-like protein 3 [Discoglossus pictus]
MLRAHKLKESGFRSELSPQKAVPWICAILVIAFVTQGPEEVPPEGGASGSNRGLSETAAVVENAAAVKPVVSLEPPWRKIFTGESVTLTCNVATDQGKGQYVWYKDGRRINGNNKFLSTQKAETGDTGNYQCTASNSERSDGVRLDVSNEYVILQVPYIVFEEDDLSLRCPTSSSSYVKSVTFYRNGQKLSSRSPDYTKKGVDLSSSGKYRCDLVYTNYIWVYSDETDVTIQELFPAPIISVRPSSMTEGDNMAVSCDTTVHPLRSAKNLYFAFYKNGQKVKEFSSSNEYQVGSAHLEDAGDYTCEAKTQTGNVRKMSQRLNIRIIVEQPSGVTVSLKPMEGQLIEGNNLEVTCSVTTGTGLLGFSWCNLNTKHCEKQQVKAQEHRFMVESVTRSYSGQYYCAVLRDQSGEPERSKNVWINVRVGVSKPHLTIGLREVAVGGDVDLACESDSGSFPIHYKFYHKGIMLENVTVHQKGKAQLRFTNVSLNMSGPYHCDSTNDISEAIRSEEITLSVMEPVSGVRISSENDLQELKPGDKLTLNCSVERGTSPTIRWLHNEEDVDNDSELYQIIDTGKVLFVQSVQVQHGGTYKCLVSNQLSPNTTVQSKILTINVSDSTQALLGSSLGVALLVLLLICALLVFKYRQKLPPSLGKCCFTQPQTGSKLSNTQNRTPPRAENEDTHDLQEYYNVSRDRTTQESVCYTSINISYAQKGAAAPATNNDQCSVTYAMIKHVDGTLNTQEDSMQDTPDSSDSIYQNFNSK